MLKVQRETLEEKSKVKCRYNDKGYCYYKNKCKFYHSDQICEPFLKEGKCKDGPKCSNRHPKKCKYLEGDIGGCRREGFCRYFHKQTENVETKMTEQKKDATTETEEGFKPNSTVNELEKDLEHKDNTINI